MPGDAPEEFMELFRAARVLFEEGITDEDIIISTLVFAARASAADMPWLTQLKDSLLEAGEGSEAWESLWRLFIDTFDTLQPYRIVDGVPLVLRADFYVRLFYFDPTKPKAWVVKRIFIDVYSRSVKPSDVKVKYEKSLRMADIPAGLDYMIEQERRGTHGDPGTETERWLEEISEVGRKRARYQEMAAERLIDFEELRTRLAALEDTRKTAERELHALQHRRGLAQLECDRDTLLENYAGVLPEAIDALESEERHRVYKMIGMEAHLAPDRSFELSGDVMSFSKVGISSA